MHKNLTALYNIRQSDIAGTMPYDLTKRIVLNASNKAEIKEDIKTAIKSFQQAVVELREGEKILQKMLPEIINADFITQSKKHLDNGGINEYVEFLNKTFSYEALSKKQLETLENQASQTIKNALVNMGALNDSDAIKINFLASGSFGHAFNISFSDKNGNKLIHDKTIKIYRNRELEQEIRERIDKKEQELKYAQSFDDYFTLRYTELINTMPKGIILTQELYDAFKAACLIKYNEAQSMIKDDFEFKFEDDYALDIEDECIDEHGCFAEANRALFIKNKIPNMKTTNLIEPFFFDLKNRFALFETADDELGKVKKEIDLKKLNLKHSDINNPDNIINGRLIDYGGITKIN